MTPSIPENTAVPSDWRISAPAPVAIANGTTPKMKAKDVIRIGRRRVRAAHDRLRPILMTSFAFILGSVPLLLATGAGAELRQALGTAVFFGMVGVTGFGLIFTPTFYVVCRASGDRITRRRGSSEPALVPAE